MLTGLATINGLRLFTLDVATGTLTAAPDADLTKAIDQLYSVSARERAHIYVECTVSGHYEWQAGQTIKPVKGKIAVQVDDDVCWKPESSMKEKWWQVVETSKVGEGQCRATCRASAHCGLYVAETADCKFLAPCSSPRADDCFQLSKEKVFEKIGNCSQASTCLVLEKTSASKNPLWLFQGIYCPEARGIDPSTGEPVGYTYQKTGLTVEGSFYLQAVEADPMHRCNSGSLVLRTPDPSWDFDNHTSQVIELHGKQLACLKPPKPTPSLVETVFNVGTEAVALEGIIKDAMRISLKSPSCSLKGLNLTVDSAEAELSSSQEAMLIDDPSTSTPDDYSLHPCECFPESWGSSAAFRDIYIQLSLDTIILLACFLPGAFSDSVSRCLESTRVLLQLHPRNLCPRHQQELPAGAAGKQQRLQAACRPTPARGPHVPAGVLAGHQVRLG